MAPFEASHAVLVPSGSSLQVMNGCKYVLVLSTPSKPADSDSLQRQINTCFTPEDRGSRISPRWSTSASARALSTATGRRPHNGCRFPTAPPSDPVVSLRADWKQRAAPPSDRFRVRVFQHRRRAGSQSKSNTKRRSGSQIWMYVCNVYVFLKYNTAIETIVSYLCTSVLKQTHTNSVYLFWKIPV